MTGTGLEPLPPGKAPGHQRQLLSGTQRQVPQSTLPFGHPGMAEGRVLVFGNGTGNICTGKRGQLPQVVSGTQRQLPQST